MCVQAHLCPHKDRNTKSSGLSVGLKKASARLQNYHNNQLSNTTEVDKGSVYWRAADN